MISSGTLHLVIEYGLPLPIYINHNASTNKVKTHILKIHKKQERKHSISANMHIQCISVVNCLNPQSQFTDHASRAFKVKIIVGLNATSCSARESTYRPSGIECQIKKKMRPVSDFHCDRVNALSYLWCFNTIRRANRKVCDQKNKVQLFLNMMKV